MIQVTRFILLCLSIHYVLSECINATVSIWGDYWVLVHRISELKLLILALLTYVLLVNISSAKILCSYNS